LMPEVTDFRYTEDLLLRRPLHGEGILFYIYKDWRVSFKIDGEWHSVMVLAGFASDGASIPRLARSIISVLGRHFEAAVIHDYLLTTAMFTKEIADKVFLAAMIFRKVKPWKRALMYRAVRLFGRGSY